MKQILIFFVCSLNTFIVAYRCSDRFPLVTDLSQANCKPNHYYKENYIFDCFPGCYPVEHDMNEVECHAEMPCPPGWKCPNSVPAYCEIDEESCFKYYIEIPGKDNKYLKAEWKPECLPNGKWHPKQCKGELTNGRCFCNDERGKRIFGQQWISKAANMTCACSRRKAELLESGRWFVSLHCDSMGNYEPLQCDSGQCWCVEPTTGKLTSTIVTESLMTYLPCYDVKQMGKQYLRQCESQTYAQARIAQALKIHGNDNANFVQVLCDDDGSYGTFKINKGNVYCTWRNNSNIGSWQSEVSLINQLDCNCARDSVIFENEGLSMKQICAGNGNYEPLQQTDTGLFYCVDSDGYVKSEYSNNKLDCSQYV